MQTTLPCSVWTALLIMSIICLVLPEPFLPMITLIMLSLLTMLNVGSSVPSLCYHLYRYRTVFFNRILCEFFGICPREGSKPGLQLLLHLLIAWLAQQSEHVLLICLHAGLVKGIDPQQVAGQAARVLEEIDQVTHRARR